MSLIDLSFFPQCTSFQPIRWQSKGHLVKAESVWIRSSTRILLPQIPSETLTSTAITPTSRSTAGRVRNALIYLLAHLKTLSDVCCCICQVTVRLTTGCCRCMWWSGMETASLCTPSPKPRNPPLTASYQTRGTCSFINHLMMNPLHEFTLTYNKQSKGLCVLSEGRAQSWAFFFCACLSGLGHAVYESLSDEYFSRLSLLSVPERVSVVTAAVNSHCNAT